MTTPPWDMESYTKFTYRCRIREKWFCTMNSVIPDYIVLFLAKPFDRSCEGIPGIQSSSQITASFQYYWLKMLHSISIFNGKHFNICSTKCIGAICQRHLLPSGMFSIFSNFSYFLKMIFNLLYEANGVLFPLNYFYPLLGSENPSFPHW